MTHFLLWCLAWPLVVAAYYAVMVRLVGVQYAPEALPKLSKVTGSIYAGVGLILVVFAALNLLRP